MAVDNLGKTKHYVMGPEECAGWDGQCVWSQQDFPVWRTLSAVSQAALGHVVPGAWPWAMGNARTEQAALCSVLLVPSFRPGPGGESTQFCWMNEWAGYSVLKKALPSAKKTWNEWWYFKRLPPMLRWSDWGYSRHRSSTLGSLQNLMLRVTPILPPA